MTVMSASTYVSLFFSSPLNVISKIKENVYKHFATYTFLSMSLHTVRC